MITEHIDYPYYFKLINDKSFYCLINSSKIQEVQRIGKLGYFFEREIKILPDRVWLDDVLLDDINYVISSESEFLAMKKICF